MWIDEHPIDVCTHTFPRYCNHVPKFNPSSRGKITRKCKLFPILLHSSSSLRFFFFMWNFGWFQLSHFRSTCKLLNTGENCELLVGYMAVYRIAITLSAFFFFMSLITVGLRTSQGWRANFHNGCWIWKFLILIGISIGIMCIPNEKIAHFQLGISSEHDSSLRLYSQWLSMTRTFSMTLYYLFIKYIYC